MTALVYLHGFLSGPESTKAQLTKAWLEANRPDIQYLCPKLSAYPRKARATLEELMDRLAPAKPILVGSSLGGYWATWLSETYQLPAVLINPAVKPSMLLPEFLHVELKNYYSDESYVLGEQDVKSLLEVQVDQLAVPENFWLMVQTGDEHLDYKLAVDKYRLGRQLVEEEGSHSFENFELWLPSILRFLENRREQLLI